MISDRAWYLAAAGVLGFGLSHSLLNSGADLVAQISDRTLASVKQVSMGARDCQAGRKSWWAATMSTYPLSRSESRRCRRV